MEGRPTGYLDCVPALLKWILRGMEMTGCGKEAAEQQNH